MEVERVKGKVFEERAGFPTQYGPERTDRQPGFPLFPHEGYRDLVVIFILTGMAFVLTGLVTPPLGPARNPVIQPFIVPDWYILFSYGLLKIADVIQNSLASTFNCGSVCTVPGPFGPIDLSADFWGNMLSIPLPLLLLLILPFLDRGIEARPAKAPFRSALGIASLIVFIFSASMYSINNLILEKWPHIGGDDVLKQFFLWPPLLAFVAAYVGLRRLGYGDMYWYRVVPLMASFLIFTAYAIFLIPVYAPTSFLPVAVVYLVLLGALTAVPAFAVTWTGESKAMRLVKWFSLGLVTALAVFSTILILFFPAQWRAAQAFLAGNMHVVVALPAFSVLTAYLGLRRPYSTYEFLLNECYQCGKCHEVCPVTKVEDDAVGGLNLVYNTFKKQHDGVPLWTCLACDACSAVCPLDIKYSDYILEERAKALAMPAPDGGTSIPDDR